MGIKREMQRLKTMGKGSVALILFAGVVIWATKTYHSNNKQYYSYDANPKHSVPYHWEGKYEKLFDCIKAEDLNYKARGLDLPDITDTTCTLR